MATLQDLLTIIENKRKLLRITEKETEMAIEHLQVRDMERQKETEMTIEHLQVRDMERQRRLFEQQIEELHSCKMKVQEQKIAEGE